MDTPVTADLEALPPLGEEGGSSQEARRRGTPVGRAALVAAVVLSVILVAVGVFELQEQTSLLRQQRCLAVAQARLQVTNTDATQLAAAQAVGRCINDTALAAAVVNVTEPGLVSLPLAEARRDLAQVGLRAIIHAGDPASDNSVVTAQAPPTGAVVPAGSVVELSTHAP